MPDENKPKRKRILKNQCKARTRQTGKQCGRAASVGRNVCRLHGGESLAGGPSHPSFKHGKYSKFLPKRLLENYETALNDTELLTLRNEIGLIDSRLIELFGSLDVGESGALWQELQRSVKKYKAENENALDTELERIFSIVNDGYKDYKVWQEVYLVAEQRKKLVESERKRYVEMGQIITTTQASTLMAHIVNVIKDNVNDTSTLENIATGLTGLMGRLSKPLEQ
ncbi:MAG: hypothetical protein OEY10_00030 [Nitrosopumilus sp.]|nr:hypothetical protein [Nitrosopumilus sp.]